MELRDFLIPLRKWWWLLVIATLVSTASSFVATTLEAPRYRTRATLMIGRAIEDPNPNSLAIYLTQQLAESYADIARRQVVREPTMEQLGLSWLPPYDVSIVPNTQLLEITVTDTSPERAQAVANTLAEQLVLQAPTSEQQMDQQRQAFVDQQLDQLEVRIQETEAEIDELQTEMVSMVSAQQIADAEEQIRSLEIRRNTLQSNYASLLANTREGAVNSMRIIETARLPGAPINANRMTTILLGAVIGLSLAAGAAYLMEYLDNSVKAPADVEEALGAPLIGFILDTVMPDTDSPGVVTAEQPRSPAAESYRAVRTNLEFASVDAPLQTILVTSANPGDGKSLTAANLAVSIAQGGKRTLLIDADLRRPRAHQLFGLPNRYGLSDLFRDQMTIDEATQSGPYPDIPLSVLTSGPLPPNPAELVGSAKMDQILTAATEMADVVILDSPPFVVSDPSILAARLDGVILVVQPRQTKAATLERVAEQLQRAGANVVGAVLNRIPRKDNMYYDNYSYYYAPYYYSSHYYLEDSHNGNGHGPVPKEKNRLQKWLVGRGRDKEN